MTKPTYEELLCAHCGAPVRFTHGKVALCATAEAELARVRGLLQRLKVAAQHLNWLALGNGSEELSDAKAAVADAAELANDYLKGSAETGGEKAAIKNECEVSDSWSWIHADEDGKKWVLHGEASKRILELEKDVEHWKANHGECVRRKRVKDELLKRQRDCKHERTEISNMPVCLDCERVWHLIAADPLTEKEIARGKEIAKKHGLTVPTARQSSSLTPPGPESREPEKLNNVHKVCARCGHGKIGHTHYHPWQEPPVALAESSLSSPPPQKADLSAPTSPEATRLSSEQAEERTATEGRE